MTESSEKKQKDVTIVTVPEKGPPTSSTMGGSEDKGITYDGPAGKARLPAVIAESMAPAFKVMMYMASSGVLFYWVCKGVALLWHP